MSEPCKQGERLATLETILEQMADTLSEQKALGVKTYEVLADLSEQGAEIRSLTSRSDKAEKDIEEAFKSIRKIDRRHAEEDGMNKVEARIEERQQKFWDGIKSQFTEKALIGMLFIMWLLDKYNVPQSVHALWKEFIKK